MLGVGLKLHLNMGRVDFVFSRSRAVSTLTYLEGPCPFLLFELYTRQNIISIYFCY